MALNLLCSQGWPWYFQMDLSFPIFQVLGLLTGLCHHIWQENKIHLRGFAVRMGWAFATGALGRQRCCCQAYLSLEIREASQSPVLEETKKVKTLTIVCMWVTVLALSALVLLERNHYIFSLFFCLYFIIILVFVYTRVRVCAPVRQVCVLSLLMCLPTCTCRSTCGIVRRWI